MAFDWLTLQNAKTIHLISLPPITRWISSNSEQHISEIQEKLE